MSNKIEKILDNNDEDDEEEIPKYKIILLGDSDVGKTSLILRYCTGNFSESGLSTTGVDTQIQYIKYNGKKVGLEIWDTAGQERFKSLARNCYKGADGIILMYDLTSKKTFQSIKIWYNNIRDTINLNTVAIIMVGNKSDVSNNIQVKKEACDKFCSQYNLYSIETSCKNNENIDETFEYLIDKIMKENNYQTQYKRTSKLTEFKKQSKKKKCCN